MFLRHRLLPSPATTIASLALCAALGGVAIAAPSSPSAFSKAELKSLAKRQAARQIAALVPKLADERIDARAPQLSVAKAGDAQTLAGKPAGAFASAVKEPFHEVGEAGEPGFQNGWHPLDSANASTPAFYLDPLGVVHLKGRLVGATNSAVAFTLPPAYRPPQNMFMPAAGAGPIAANVLVRVNGDVQPTCDGTGTCSLAIDGLSYRAAEPSEN